MANNCWQIGGLIRKILPGFMLVLCFFIVGLVSLNDYGVTFDEPETIAAGLQNARALTGSIAGGMSLASRHELPGYYYWIDTLRGLFAVKMTSLGYMDVPTSFHCIQLLLSTVAIFLLYLLVLHLTERIRPALFAALSLAFFPKFIAHSQNNPKDLPGLFVFVLALSLLIYWGDKGGIRRCLAAGAGIGVALATSVVTLFVLPVAGLWLLFNRRERLRQEWGQLLLMAGLALVTFFIFWPWLWTDTQKHLLHAYKLLTTFNVDQPLLFFGSLYTWKTTPWYYFLGSFFVSTPMTYLLLAPASLLVFCKNSLVDLVPLKRAAGLGVIWCSVLILAELQAALHYDGVRHFLVFLPGFCILIGIGVDMLLLQIERSASRQLKTAGLVLLSAGYLLVVVAVMRVHPYEDAYLNEVINAWISGPAEDYFETEYWGTSYREGADWLNRNMEAEAVSYYVFTQQVNFYLQRPAVGFDPSSFFQNSSRPQYLIFMNRVALLDDNLRRVEREYRPVFTINRQKGTLLKIYKNTVKK